MGVICAQYDRGGSRGERRCRVACVVSQHRISYAHILLCDCYPRSRCAYPGILTASRIPRSASPTPALDRGISRDPLTEGLILGGDAPNVRCRFAPRTRYSLATGSPPVCLWRLRYHRAAGTCHRWDFSRPAHRRSAPYLVAMSTSQSDVPTREAGWL